MSHVNLTLLPPPFASRCLHQALFFVNERVWAAIDWGKKYEPEYFI